MTSCSGTPQSDKNTVEFQTSVSITLGDQDQSFSHLTRLEEENKSSISSSSKKIKKEPRPSKKCLQDDMSPCDSSDKKQRRTWKPDEDAQVLHLISKHGQRWKQIADIMATRSAKQIRDRYLHKLRPTIQKISWCKEEDQLLLTLYDRYGSKWSKIVQHMPSRTENQVRNRYNSRLKYNPHGSISPDQTLETTYFADVVSPSIDSKGQNAASQFVEECLSRSASANTQNESLMTSYKDFDYDHLDTFEPHNTSYNHSLLSCAAFLDLDSLYPSCPLDNELTGFSG